MLLQTAAPNIEPKILMGIELKGWFVLSGEGEPSFRYRVNPNVCAPADLLAVFLWILDEVISGRPRLMTPFVAEARFAALHRNYYWTYMRGVTGEDARIVPAQHQEPYPQRRQRFLDAAVRDPGHNFGRIARGQIMDSFIRALNARPVAGIALGAWQRFFDVITEDRSEASIRNRLSAIARSFAAQTERSEETELRLQKLLSALADFGFGEATA